MEKNRGEGDESMRPDMGATSGYTPSGGVPLWKPYGPPGGRGRGVGGGGGTGRGLSDGYTFSLLQNSK